jgi:hypothetical protein
MNFSYDIKEPKEEFNILSLGFSIVYAFVLGMLFSHIF